MNKLILTLNITTTFIFIKSSAAFETFTRVKVTTNVYYDLIWDFYAYCCACLCFFAIFHCNITIKLFKFDKIMPFIAKFMILIKIIT